MKRWFAVHTQAQAENKAQFNLIRQGFETYLPMFLKRRSHARRVDWTPKPVFPRYLFIALDLGHTPWRTIQSTFGVSHMVCIGEKPAALPDGAVEDLMAAEDERGYFRFNHSMEFKKGQTVKINSGPLSDVIAIFEDMADSERVAVLLELLGRKVRVKLPFEAISSFA